MMKKLSLNYGREDGLETVLEVTIPEEMFASNKNSGRSWHNVKSWMRSHVDKTTPSAVGSRSTELQLLLGVVGAPLIPLPVRNDHSFITRDKFKDRPIESSMAKYIVQQYIAATGGDTALNSIKSMCAVGKVKMAASEFSGGDDKNGHKGIMKVNNKGGRHGHGHGGGGEVGGFVLWQKRPGKWCLELVLSGCKISAGSDGNVAWRQTPWHHSHASRGPPRPLRRSLQGLDPRLTANLFSESVCIGERRINEEDCFVLKLETEESSLMARSGNNVEIIRHSVWGYFSQRTGLLVQLEDSHLLRIKTASDDSVFWETTMESFIHDYRCIDGVNIAHAGRTAVSLFRFGESSETHSRTRMEEVWTIEEFDFNVEGLSRDFFLPPADLKKDTVKEPQRQQQEEQEGCGYDHQVPSPITANARLLPFRNRPPSSSAKVGCSKVAAVNVDDLDSVPVSTQVDSEEL
ncbi:uncharacterized protein LOC122656750 [Telopea speciosissima]|uniref:uncharacterized protein LOC122656750 n=1 Tax=Telopea speciosissima TaxID=54955 RepID=UPI001CC48C74|nr:uncharacterized protein LOC122656750 [Telopea speciosissima]